MIRFVKNVLLFSVFTANKIALLIVTSSAEVYTVNYGQNPSAFFILTDSIVLFLSIISRPKVFNYKRIIVFIL